MKTAGRVDLKPLTSLRGIAAAMVVVYHYTGGFLPAINLGASTGLVARGYLFVDLFFVLSGFVMAHAYSAAFDRHVGLAEWSGFVRARLARVYPLHLVILLGFVGLETAKWLATRAGFSVGTPFNEASTAGQFVLNLLLLQTSGLLAFPTWNGPAWSIGAEFLVYLAFPFVSVAIMRSGRGLRAGIAIAAVALLLAISEGGVQLDQTARLGALRCLGEFTLGMLAYRLYAETAVARFAGTPAVVCAAGATLLALHFEAPDILVPLGFTVVILLVAANRGAAARLLSAPWLVTLGLVSYSVYMVHYLLLEIVDLASRILTGGRIGEGLGVAPALLVFAAMVAAVLVISIQLHRRVEEPARRWLRASPDRAPHSVQPGVRDNTVR